MSASKRSSNHLKRNLLAVAGAIVAALVLIAADEPPATSKSKLPPPPTDPASKPDAKLPAPPTEPPARPAKDPEIDVDQARYAAVEDGRPVLGADLNSGELHAYRYTLLHARDVPVEKMREKAREDLKFAHLWEEPKKFRGSIVHIEGLLRKLTPYDADRELAKEAGIKTVYEGWIFADDNQYPYCVIFTELPEGVKLDPKDDYKVRYQISCDAYYFKKYRYPGQDRAKRDAPLFLGHSFKLLKQQAAPESDWKSLLPFFIIGGLVLTGALVGLFVGLNWWFRRGDLLTQRRLALAREASFVEPPPDDATPSPPAIKPAAPTEFPPPGNP
jgi:hypothetical protein